MKSPNFIREENTVNDFQPEDRVIYVPTHAIEEYSKHGKHPNVEYGFVKSVNEYFVFVNYFRHNMLQYTAEATNPKDLIKQYNKDHELPKIMKCYELVSENLTHLGGPMGSEYTTTNFRKYFNDSKKAKLFAEKDFGKKIKWLKTGKGWTSGDLSWVMYYINEIKIKNEK